MLYCLEKSVGSGERIPEEGNLYGMEGQQRKDSRHQNQQRYGSSRGEQTGIFAQKGKGFPPEGKTRGQKENGDVEVYLTRYYEECENCPLFEKECQGDVPPFPNDKYPCHNMKPIFPYEEQGYEFYDINDIEEHSELTDLDKEAIRMIWTNWEEVEKILYSPNK